MSLLSAAIASALVLQAGADRADVTFVNDSKFPISVFMKETRKKFGPIDSGDFLKIEKGFALGENDYLVVRSLRDRNTLKEFALISPARFRLYRSAAGRPPAAATIEVGDDAFKTLKHFERESGFRVENNTDYPVYVFVRGQASPYGPVGEGKTRTFDTSIPFGKAELVVIAQKEAPLGGGASEEIVDVAFLSLDAPRRASRTPTLVISGRTFGERGLPLKLRDPVTPAPQFSIQGKWRTPEGTSVRFEGSNGYWIEVKNLAEFGFKPGDHGFRNLKEDPNKRGTFTGEVLYRFRGGEIDGWKPFSIWVKDSDTLANSTGDWKRID